MRRGIIIFLILLLITVGALWWFAPLRVVVVQPVRGTAIDAVYATGIIEPTVMLPIAPRVSGHLKKLLVDEGDAVRKGQELAQLEDADLDYAVNELAARERYAREQYQRTQTLVQRGLTAAVDLDQTRSNWQAAEAALKRARSQRDFMSLKAPAEGQVVRRDGELGQYIASGQPLFYVSTNAPLRVTAEVDEEDITRVRVGQVVVLTADAMPGKTFNGRVSEVTPKGDPVTRSYRIRIQLYEPDAFRIGMTVEASLIVRQQEQALLIDNQALVNQTVWVVRNQRLVQQPVVTGIVGERRVEIVRGLSDTDQVVQMPTAALQPQQRVKPVLEQQNH